jgi:hypothetical protein
MISLVLSQPNALNFMKVTFTIYSHFHTADFLSSDLEKMTCDNTDLEKVAELSQRMLDALMGNSMKKHPRQISGQVTSVEVTVKGAGPVPVSDTLPYPLPVQRYCLTLR